MDQDQPHKDHDQLKQLAAGNSHYISNLYKLYFPNIKYFVTRNNGTEQDARDIFQDALVVLYNKAIDPGFVLTSSLLTYIYSVCRFMWLKHLRKKSHHEVTISDTMVYIGEGDLEQAFIEREKYKLVREKFDLLPKDCQKILDMFFDRMKMAEISNAMGHASVGYTNKRKSKCKDKLIELIKNDQRFKDFTSDGD